MMFVRLAKAFPRCEFTAGLVYCVYYKLSGKRLVILLAGGDKRTQATDIKTAFYLAQHLEELE